jgi:flagellar capping protein FliD
MFPLRQKSTGDLASSMALRVATIQSESFGTLIGSLLGGKGASSNLDFLSALKTDSAKEQGLAASGRNLSLFNPESAYRMMSVINTRDVTYKAQYAELSELGAGVKALQGAAETLGSVDQTMDDATIRAKLQDFADKYNAWIERFDPTVGTNGLLAGTQAAEISLYELEQSVENIFNGAASGFRGLNDLGFSIDPSSNLLSIDLAELDAALAKSKNGALDTVQQFAANFAKSAELLNSSNNFIPNRLNNLDRVIDYITDNKTSLQAEFGLGDAARPSAEVSKALAVYNKIYAS